MSCPNSASTEQKQQQQEELVKICSVNDYQQLAKQTLPKPLYEYLASGTDDEQTLQENRSAFKAWYIQPRVMRPVGNLSCAVTLKFTRNPNYPPHVQSQTFQMPIFTSPAGVHALCDPVNGECATARACDRMGTLFGLSQHATRSIEEIGSILQRSNHDTPSWWYQLYILKDRELTKDLANRAAQAGCKGIFLTVDSVRFGYREVDARNGFDALPPPHRLVNYDKYKNNNDNDAQNASSSGGGGLDETYNGRKHKSWDQNSELLFDQNVTWNDIQWLKQNTACRNLPLILKGILTPEDAVAGIEAGADGIMVSNHGGRQQDGCLATIDALPAIVSAVRALPGGRDIPIFLDGGIRRGTDVLKALALGASMVGVGKPLFFALACGGQQAVEDMLSMMKKELEASMALTGCATLEEVHTRKNLVIRHPNGGTQPARYIRSML